jgi:hypothetical protein
MSEKFQPPEDYLNYKREMDHAANMTTAVMMSVPYSDQTPAEVIINARIVGVCLGLAAFMHHASRGTDHAESEKLKQMCGAVQESLGIAFSKVWEKPEDYYSQIDSTNPPTVHDSKATRQ